MKLEEKGLLVSGVEVNARPRGVGQCLQAATVLTDPYSHAAVCLPRTDSAPLFASPSLSAALTHIPTSGYPGVQPVREEWILSCLVATFCR